MEQRLKNLLGEYAFHICSLQAQLDALKAKEDTPKVETDG